VEVGQRASRELSIVPLFPVPGTRIPSPPLIRSDTDILGEGLGEGTKSVPTRRSFISVAGFNFEVSFRSCGLCDIVAVIYRPAKTARSRESSKDFSRPLETYWGG